MQREKRAIVTTSWDDGHVLDLKLAELLQRYGVAGTLYVPKENGSMPLLSPEQMRRLRREGMEIGAHTLTHAVLPGLGKERILSELTGGKRFLEDVLGEEVPSFCYPKGKFSRQTGALAAEAGFRLVRTTLSFRVEADFDPHCMPTSLQLYPHRGAIHLRHAVKEGNLVGLWNWVGPFGCECDLLTLIGSIFDHVVSRGGVFHLWGHSWEIEQMGLWDLLEKALSYISRRPGVSYLTNGQTLACRDLP